MMQQFRFLQVVRPSRIFWIVTLVAMVLILLFLPRSPLPWLDETFFASTSLAVARGGPPIPTVLGAFPHTGRIDLLYGPLGFFSRFTGCEALRTVNHELEAVGFFGAVGAVFSASWVSRCLDRSAAATAASAMMVALSQGIGCASYHWKARHDHAHARNSLPDLHAACNASPGVKALRISLRRARRYSLRFCGAQHPRAFPFVLGLFVAIALELLLTRTRELITRGLIIAAAALLPVWGWTLSRGTNPIGWLRFIAEVSRGDRISVSPILHGSWHFFDEPLVPLLRD